MPELELPIWVAGIALGCLLRWANVNNVIVILVGAGIGTGAFGAALHAEPVEAKLLTFDILQGVLANFVGYYGLDLLIRKIHRH